jgi:hypothetical protein
MSELNLPREWCSTGTKTDPGAAAALTGFEAGNPMASAHFNFLWNQSSVTSREQFRRACYPRKLAVTDDTTGRFAVIGQGIGPHKQVVLANLHSAGVSLARGESVLDGGAAASISASVRGAARNSTTGRLVLVGSGGNHNCFSTNGGVSWSAGGALGGVGLEVTWNPTYSRFQAVYSGNAVYSTDATAWTAVAVAGASNSGIALLANGNTIMLVGATAAFSRSTDGGSTWGATGGTVSYSADLANKGHVCSAGDSLAYHAGLHSDGTVRVATSADGITWTQAASVSAPTGLTFSNSTFDDIKIRQCLDTGLLALVCQTTAGVVLFASGDQGATWTDGWQTDITDARSMDVAGGRIFLVDLLGTIYGTDGIL